MPDGLPYLLNPTQGWGDFLQLAGPGRAGFSSLSGLVLPCEHHDSWNRLYFPFFPGLPGNSEGSTPTRQDVHLSLCLFCPQLFDLIFSLKINCCPGHIFTRLWDIHSRRNVESSHGVGATGREAQGREGRGQGGCRWTEASGKAQSGSKSPEGAAGVGEAEEYDQDRGWALSEGLSSGVWSGGLECQAKYLFLEDQLYPRHFTQVIDYFYTIPDFRN